MCCKCLPRVQFHPLHVAVSLETCGDLGFKISSIKGGEVACPSVLVLELELGLELGFELGFGFGFGCGSGHRVFERPHVAQQSRPQHVVAPLVDVGDPPDVLGEVRGRGRGRGRGRDG